MQRISMFDPLFLPFLSVLITRSSVLYSSHNAKYVSFGFLPRLRTSDQITLDFKLDYAITHNLTPFISMQNNHSLVYREEEREMFPTLKVRSI